MNGRVDESKNGLLIVEVEDSLNSKSIITSGLYNISVSTYPSQDVMSSKTIQDYSDNNKWDELYEYRTKKPSTGIKLREKIVNKEKNNINIDQSWFEE
jgi:hypothetical protein